MEIKNNIKADPFTRTPGVAGKAYINMHHADQIINDFSLEDASKYVYKIVGLRGSGKSVEYSKILKMFKEKEDWLVYSLSAAGNLTETLIAKLSNEKFIDSNEYITSITGGISAGGDIKIVKGSADLEVTKSFSESRNYYSPEATLDDMIQKAKSKGYKILIGVDDISKTTEVVKFLSILGKHFLEDNPSIYLLCTGLSKNIEDFSNEPNLTFFKRSDVVEISPLSKFEIAEKYEELLNVSKEKAIELAKIVKGYAYAYQVLGSLYFSMNNESDEVILDKFGKILFQDSYDLIWQSITNSEKDFIRSVLRTSGKNKDVMDAMENPQNFPVLRNRLAKKHILNTSVRGQISIDLPLFHEFVSEWGD